MISQVKEERIKYSIVIAVYNRPEEMAELLESISLQDFKDIEIIIVDDGSEKSSREISFKYAKKLKISYYFTENQGPALARNFGVSKSVGEWILFFDSDCTIPKNYFFEVEKFLKNNSIDFFGGPDMMDDSFSILQKSINFSMTSLLTTGGIRGNKRSIDKFLPRSFNMGIRRKDFDEVGGFSDIRQYGEDLDLSYKLIFSEKKSALIPEAKVFHKRRTTLFQFFNQMFKSGKGRHYLNLKYNNTFKPFHLFPSFFVIGIISIITLFIFNFMFFSSIISLIYLSYASLIFIFSSLLNKNILIGVISVVTTFYQFIGYGLGYIFAVFRR